MKDPNELLLRAVRGDLQPGEREQWQELLAADSGLQRDFAEEEALENALERLPNVPVSSNFTALVMQRIETESQRDQIALRPSPVRSWLRFAFARVAVGLTAVLIIGLSAVHQYRKAEHTEFAKKIGVFTEVASAVGSEDTEEVWQNFDAIHRLSLPSEGELDLELLAALQK